MIPLQISSRKRGALRPPEGDQKHENPGPDRGVMHTIF